MSATASDPRGFSALARQQFALALRDYATESGDLQQGFLTETIVRLCFEARDLRMRPEDLVAFVREMWMELPLPRPTDPVNASRTKSIGYYRVVGECLRVYWE